MGCGYFHQAQLKEEGLKTKILTTQAKLSTTICVGFQQVFSIQGHLLEVDLKLWTNKRFQ
jgi:hypothetical protein